jgi:hypothetical protein
LLALDAEPSDDHIIGGSCFEGHSMANSRTAAGVTLLVASVILTPLVWLGGRVTLAVVAFDDPVPNQGVMVLVFLGFLASVAVAVCLGVAGLIVLLRRP